MLPSPERRGRTLRSSCKNQRTRIEKDLEGNDRFLIEPLFRYLPGGIEENHEKFKISGIPAVIRSELFLIRTQRETATLACSVREILKKRREIMSRMLDAPPIL
jgi:hypothetical protein